MAPLVRDGLYDGTQTVTKTDNGDGAQTVTTSYDNRVYNAATAAIAMLAGGALAGALGQDANAAAAAAQNEAINNSTSPKYHVVSTQIQACNGQPLSCYQNALVTAQAAYQQAQQDVSTSCGSGGDAASCRTARSDAAQLSRNVSSLKQLLQNTPDCQSVGCVVATTAGTDIGGLVVGSLLGKAIGYVRGLFVSPAAATGGPSASSLVPTGGDFDLPNVYVNQVQTPAGIATPYGPALQSNSSVALNAISQVQQGATLFRLGTLGQSQAAEAQFWSLQNPLTTPNYPGLYGIPPENVTNANFLETAILKPGTPFVTRPAPPVGTNPGGGIEVVVPSGGVQMKSFSVKGVN